MTKKDVFVSIVMPVFNCEQYVGAATQSILDQTYTNFEFLIFDDRSTDRTIDIINAFTDPRIKVYEKQEEENFVDLLNRGLRIAQGKYIARMDGDDISLPHRIEEQVRFLEANPDCGLLGSFAKCIGSASTLLKKPTEHKDILAYLLFATPLIHPSVMFRKTVLMEYDIHYKRKYLLAEDYEIFLQLSQVTKLATLPEVMLHYRIHSKNLSKLHHTKQMQIMCSLRINPHEQFLERPLSSWEKSFLKEEINFNYPELQKSKVYLQELMAKNQKENTFNAAFFRSLLLERMFYMIFKHSTIQWSLFRKIPGVFYIFPVFLRKKYTYRFFASVILRFIKRLNGALLPTKPS